MTAIPEEVVTDRPLGGKWDMDGSSGIPHPWIRMPLTILAMLVIVAAAAAMLIPGASTALTDSTTKRAVHYVELYLDGAKAPSCAAIARAHQIHFAVASHLADDQRLTYVVTADQKRLAHGQVDTTPGRTTTVRPTVHFNPRHTDQLVVELVGREEHLTVHCGRGPGA